MSETAPNRVWFDDDVRVARTFAFIDLCGFTSLTSAHGDEPAVALLAEFRASVRDVCSRRGVRIAKWLGDGAMLVCVEVAPAVAAAVEIENRMARRRSPLAIRAGLSCGDVILFEGDDYIGHAVNLAARICDLAEAHEILATQEVVAHAPPWVARAPAGIRFVRGLAHPVTLVELGLRPDRDDHATDPVCRMEIPRAAAATTRAGPDGETVFFCSHSCAETWDGRPLPHTDSHSGDAADL